MIKLLPLIVSPLIFACSVQAQENKIKRDTLTQDQYREIIHKQFGSLISGSTVNTIGSFASLDLKDPSVTFSPNFFLNNGNVISAKASGGVSDGFFEVLKNTKFNPSVSLDLEYSFLYKDQSKKILNGYIEYIPTDLDALDTKKREAETEYSYSKLKLKHNQDLNVLKLEKIKQTKRSELELPALIDSLNVQLKISNDTLTKRLDRLKFAERKEDLTEADNSLSKTDYDSIKSGLAKKKTVLDKLIAAARLDSANLSTKIASAKYEIEHAQLKLDVLEKKEALLKDEVYIEKQKLAAINKRNKVNQEASATNLNLVGFQFGWFSAGYRLKYDEFKLFDPTLELDSQIVKENFTSHQFRLGYSFYKWSNQGFRTVYFNIAGKYNYRSNFSDLAKVEINETTPHGSSTFERSTIEQYNAYKGTYRAGVHELEVSAHLYYFLFKENSVALHVYPNFRMRTGEFSIASLGFGILAPFKNKKKDDPIINAELYYNLTDLFNPKNQTTDLLDRNSIGLRFTFPIDFKPVKS